MLKCTTNQQLDSKTSAAQQLIAKTENVKLFAVS